MEGHAFRRAARASQIFNLSFRAASAARNLLSRSARKSRRVNRRTHRRNPAAKRRNITARGASPGVGERKGTESRRDGRIAKGHGSPVPRVPNERLVTKACLQACGKSPKEVRGRARLQACRQSLPDFQLVLPSGFSREESASPQRKEITACESQSAPPQPSREAAEDYSPGRKPRDRREEKEPSPVGTASWKGTPSGVP